jgi:hypothetical protein
MTPINAPTVGASSPWGRVQQATPFMRNGQTIAVCVSSASHGGFWVAPHLRTGLAAIETAYSRGGWFEEDCDWALAYIGLDLGRIDPERDLTEAALRSLNVYHPERYAALCDPAA